MRWTKNDSLAYGAFSDLGDRLGEAVVKRKVGDAWGANPVEEEQYDYNDGVQKKYRLGNQVQDTPFTPEQLDQGRARMAADVYGRIGMPEQGYKLRSMAKQDELAGLQMENARLGLKKGRREEKYAQNEDAWFEFQQQFGHLPDEEYFPAAARFASSKIQDGKTFGVTFDPNEGWRAAVTDTNSGQVTFRPIPGRQQFDSALQRYLSPRMLADAQKQDNENRRFSQVDQKLGQGDRQLGLLQQRVDQQGKLMDAQAGAWEALARQRGTELKIPEADKIRLQGIERQEQLITTALTKLDPNDPASAQQSAALRQQFVQLRKQSYGLRAKYNLVNGPQWADAGMPNPMEKARVIMHAFGGLGDGAPARLGMPRLNPNQERELYMAVEQFRELYSGNDPESAEALNALETFATQMRSQVKPEHSRPPINFRDLVMPAGGGMGLNFGYGPQPSAFDSYGLMPPQARQH